MEKQEKKSVKPIVIAVIITLLFSAGVVYWGGQTVVQDAYDRGHVNGYADGIAKGKEAGYWEGYTAGLSEAKNASENFIGNNSDTEYLTTDNAPAGTVWITPYGEKYHEGWCRYISGRNDLTYFYSADDAENAGYTPCSVCH